MGLVRAYLTRGTCYLTLDIVGGVNVFLGMRGNCPRSVMHAY